MKKVIVFILIIIAILLCLIAFLLAKNSEIPSFVETRENSSAPIVSNNLDSYLSGVAQVDCKNSKGSGSLWTLSDGTHAILTNYHVIEDAIENPQGDFCYLWIHDIDGNVEGLFSVYTKEDYFIDRDQDIALLPIRRISVPGLDIDDTAKIEDMNYSLSRLNKCSTKTTVGSPVYIIGYPASGSLEIEHSTGIANQDFRIVTEGIVSGHDTSVANSSGNNQSPDFFTSAKLDGGNSGGIALSKTDNEFCVLGVPTWVNVGEYTTQGIIQNINSINVQ